MASLDAFSTYLLVDRTDDGTRSHENAFGSRRTDNHDNKRAVEEYLLCDIIDATPCSDRYIHREAE